MSAARFGVAIAILSLVLGADRASALVIGDGWTADQPAGVTYGAVTGSGTSSDSWTFTLNLESAAFTTTTITFTNDGNSTDSYFNLTFAGKNTGTTDWNGVLITIVDTTGDTIPVEPDTTPHPVRAHIHRSSWDASTATHFQCADAFCGFNGRYDMVLGLKTGALPLAQNQTSSGSRLRLHDQDEEGTSPMSFTLAFTPIPEPGTGLLVGAGLVALRLRRRRA